MEEKKNSPNLFRVKMIRHAIQASTKHFWRGREAEVNYTRGIGDGQEWDAVVCEGCREGVWQCHMRWSYRTYFNQQFPRPHCGGFPYHILLFWMQRNFFPIFSPKCHSPVLKFQRKGVSLFSLKNVSYYKSKWPIYFSLILYMLTFIFLILNLAIMHDYIYI